MDNLNSQKSIFLDYVNSDDPSVIDRGIQETALGMERSILSAGYGLARIKSEKNI